MSRIKDLTGQRFGRLTVIEFAGTKNGHARWKCRCDCGNECVTYGRMLAGGQKMSCGCLAKEIHSKNWTTHGLSRSKIYKVWEGIRWRCLSEKAECFKDYGGRGITICNEWRDNFMAFYNYVSTLEHFDEDGYTFDRINNDGNYEPGNVRWATRLEQMNNRRVTIIVEYGGIEMPLSDAAKLAGLTYDTVLQRHLNGKRGEDLFKPSRGSLPKFSYGGEELTLKEIAKRSGIPYGTLVRRYHQGKRGAELFNHK